MAIPYKEEKLPEVQQIPFAVTRWMGLNRRRGTLDDGEMANMQNMSGEHYPYAGPRKRRYLVEGGIQNPQKLFALDGKLGYIADGVFHYDGKNSSATEEGGDEEAWECGKPSDLVVYDKRCIVYPSGAYYDATDGSFTLPKTNIVLTKEGYDYDSAMKFNKNDEAYVIKSEPISVEAGTELFINTTGFNHTEIMLLFYSGSDSSEPPDPYDNCVRYEDGITVPEGKDKLVLYLAYYWVVDRYESSPNRSFLYWAAGKDERNRRGADFTRYGRGTNNIWTSDAVYPTPSSVPQIAHACEWNNRIFAVNENDIYASCLGNFSDWTTFVTEDGSAAQTGSFATDVGSEGTFTGIVPHKGTVFLFKQNYIYELYGSNLPFRVTEAYKTGCIDGRTILEVGGALYWLGWDGIYTYRGGQPQLISDKLGSRFRSGVAGSDGRRYYACLFDGSNYGLYVYDTLTGLWHMEDNLEIVDFACLNNTLYALTITDRNESGAFGAVIGFGSGLEGKDCPLWENGLTRVPWEFETQDYHFNLECTKNVRKLHIRLQMEPQSRVDVYLKSNGEEFRRVAHYTAENETVIDFKVRVKKCDSFALKFCGLGVAKILDVHAKVTVGTLKHRSGTKLDVFRR